MATLWLKTNHFKDKIDQKPKENDEIAVLFLGIMKNKWANR
jgi:hypothetical protein